jgi:hypothetical protein
MSVKPFLHKIELNFWDVFIPYMSKSPLIRYLVPRVYRLFHTKEFQKNIKSTVVIVLTGLLLGFILGSLPLI